MTSGKGILVIEDNQDVREALMEVLVDGGYPSRGASTGEEALQWLKGASALPRLILLDLAMPGMDVRQFRRIQRDDARLGAIPIVILSGSAAGAQLAIELGAEAFLEKPVQVSDLLATVSRCVGSGSASAF